MCGDCPSNIYVKVYALRHYILLFTDITKSYSTLHCKVSVFLHHIQQ